MNYRKVNPGELRSLMDIDDKASQLYSEAGIELNFCDDHPFVLAEQDRWGSAIERGLAWCAIKEEQLVGFVVCAYVDGIPYLDQISVIPENMQQGIGTKLLNLVFKWSECRPLYLTTYQHLSWNKPWYEKLGFHEVPEGSYGLELKVILEQQRKALPEPKKRIVMLRPHRLNTL